MKHPFRTFFFFLALCGVLVASIITFRKKEKSAAVAVEVVTVKRGDVILRATETGSLEPTQVVEIKSEQAGEVKQIFVEGGDTVSVGQALATIQQESNQARKVAEARATIEQERLNLEEAEREYQRVQELFKKGFIARREVENGKKSLENAQIRISLAKRSLLLTLGGNKALFEKYLTLDLTTELLDDFTLYSPLSGKVLDVSVSVGEIVSSGTSTVTGGTALMRVADLSNMWVKTKINEVNIGQIAEGLPAEIRLDAIPDQVYQGQVVKISPKGEKENDLVTYEVTISLINSDQRLMPSMTANVDIITDEAKDVLYLPLTALTEAEGKTSVHVRDGSGGTRSQIVGIGIKNEAVAVITEGLREGDEVVLPERERTVAKRGMF